MSEATADIEDSSRESTCQFLTFVLDREEYAVDILRVQEIKSWTPVTRIPRAPDYVLGVINLRGAIVPVIDLRRRFRLTTQEPGGTTAVIIVRASADEGGKVMGLVVDRVSEVYHIGSEQIQPNPAVATSIEADFIAGLARSDEQLLIVLNLEKIVDTDFLPPATGD